MGTFSIRFFSTDVIPSIPMDGSDDYYNVVTSPPRAELEVPAELESYLDWFFKIGEKDQNKFLRSCHWLQHSNFLLPYSVSGSFIALISAIESLFDDVDGQPCEKCGTPRCMLSAKPAKHK